jgi:superfamily II DNA or RNA helicase
MARHNYDSEEVIYLRQQLTDLLLRFGSVNATVQALNEVNPDIIIHSHRVHGILSGDRNRQVNSSTLSSLRAVIAGVKRPEGYAIDPANIRDRIKAFGSISQQTVLSIADEFSIPEGVIYEVSDSVSGKTSEVIVPPQKPLSPDWSWQEIAINNCISSLRKSSASRVGLIVPTGGGKTRIALQTALRWNQSVEGRIVWITHRTQLLKQARRTLHKLLAEKGLPSDELSSQFGRIDIVMIGRLREHLSSLNDKISCFMVDEGHHIAAPGYRMVLEQTDAPVLVLTATPNRRDGLSLGLTETAFEITYQELFKKGCLLEPVFDPIENFFSLNWSEPGGLDALAEYLLDRSETDFEKLLIVVTRKNYVETLHQALNKELETRSPGVLTSEDIGFVHADRNSQFIPESSDFLDEFAAKPKGILVATDSLIGEGFDDPTIDAVFITYPSTSISKLMQVAGRALRYAPGKKRPHIIRVRTNQLEYHFSQLWLHQDITDVVRPDVQLYEYSSNESLQKALCEILGRHNVQKQTQIRILKDASEPGTETLKLMLFGVPFFGDRSHFSDSAEWSGFLVREKELHSFVRAFNDFAERDGNDAITDISFYLSRILSSTTDEWTRGSYHSLFNAINLAKDEIAGIRSPVSRHRMYQDGHHTSWLRYITLRYRPVIPTNLTEFLQDAFNLNDVSALFTECPEEWKMAIRIEYPVSGSLGVLLNTDQTNWFENWHADLMNTLGSIPIRERPNILRENIAGLASCPIPQLILQEASQLLRLERVDRHILRFTS